MGLLITAPYGEINFSGLKTESPTSGNSLIPGQTEAGLRLIFTWKMTSLPVPHVPFMSLPVPHSLFIFYFYFFTKLSLNTAVIVCPPEDLLSMVIKSLAFKECPLWLSGNKSD